MNAKWLHLAGNLLEQASEEFANHGCNDWKWPKGWDESDKWELTETMMEDNLKKPSKEFNVEEMNEWSDLMNNGPDDWWLMSFLAGQLKKESKA